MDIISRINEFVKYTGKSSSQFADEIGIPRPSFSQILNGRNKKISNELIEKFHTAFPELNISWLLFEEGSMINSSDKQEESVFTAQKTNIMENYSEPEETDLFSEHSESENSLNQENDIFEEANNDIDSDEIKNSGQKTNTTPFIDKNEHKKIVENVEVVKSHVPQESENGEHLLKINSSRAKITSIMVLYSDDTFEIFKSTASDCKR